MLDAARLGHHTDAAVEGVHFDRRFMDAGSIGHRVLAANLSDLAACGAEPRTALLSLMLPDALPLAELDALLDAFLALAARTGTHLVGGNVTRSPGPLVIDVTVSGTAKRRKVLDPLGRTGWRRAVSGSVGGAAAGLAWLQQDRGAGTPSTRPSRTPWRASCARAAAAPGAPRAGPGPRRRPWT